ncbi:hypothetical protein OK016_01090 [Vibrio chagasii]|nr:hypothetical protein [Vibrio chagasii]
MYPMVVGPPLIWFLPPWYVSAFMPEFADQYASMGDKAGDVAYLKYICTNVMPSSRCMVGLNVCNVRCNDVFLWIQKNRNAGIRDSPRQSIVRKNATIKKSWLLRHNNHHDGYHHYLDWFVSINSTSLEPIRHRNECWCIDWLPMLIPVLLGMWIRKTPDWAGLVNTQLWWLRFLHLVFRFQAEDIENPFGLETALTGRECRPLEGRSKLAAHVVFIRVVTSIILTFKRQRPNAVERVRKKLHQLFTNWNHR